MKKVLSGRTTNIPGKQKAYRSIKFSGWTKTKTDIINALKNPNIRESELKRYVRYAISEAEAASSKLDEYRNILEVLNRSSYSDADKQSAIQDLETTTLSQKDLHEHHSPTKISPSSKSREQKIIEKLVFDNDLITNAIELANDSDWNHEYDDPVSFGWYAVDKLVDTILPDFLEDAGYDVPDDLEDLLTDKVTDAVLEEASYGDFDH